MVIEHDIGAMPLATDIGMQVGGDDALRAGVAVEHLGIRPQFEMLGAEEALARPLSIRPSSSELAVEP